MDIPFATSLLSAYVRHRAKHEPVLSSEQLNIAGARRILLVLTTGIGDAILSSPVFSAIRQAAPQADIRLFCRASWVELFCHDHNLNGVIAYPGKFRKFFSTLNALTTFAPDVAVVLHGNDPDILPLCYLAGARQIVRVPTAGTRFPMLLSNLDRVEDRQVLPEKHYIENRLRVLDTLGIPVVDSAPRMYVPADVAEGLKRRLLTGSDCSSYWVLHGFAADAYKSLPEELMTGVLAAAASRFPDKLIVLTGGKQDRSRLQAWVDAVGKGTRIKIVAGDFSLAETAACLAGAQGVVAPDTGILHLAAALQRPVLGLYAPTRPSLVGPRTAGEKVFVVEHMPTCDPCATKRCPYRPVTCMAQFSVDEVLARLTELLEP